MVPYFLRLIQKCSNAISNTIRHNHPRQIGGSYSITDYVLRLARLHLGYFAIRSLILQPLAADALHRASRALLVLAA